MRIFSLLLVIFISACTFPNDNQVRKVKSLHKTLDIFNQAFRDGKLQILDSLTTDDYTHTNGSSKAFDKTSWFNYLEKRAAQLASGTLIIEKYVLIDKAVHVYGNSAVVTGKIETAGTNQGEPFENSLRISNFWVRENDIWKRAAFHDTKIEN